MSGGEVRYERVGAAAVLTIDRPERRNAVDGATAELLRGGFEDFEADDGARVLVLTGAGGEAFCAGADLKALDLDVDHPGGPMGPTRLTPSKPAIAAIDGWCLAGGVELALWCDLRIATPGSTFGLFERRWGVPLVDGGTQRLPRVVGMGRALELILTGRPVERRGGPSDRPRQRDRRPRRAPGSSARAGREDRRLPPGDDARRSPRRDRGLRPPPRRRPRPGAQAGTRGSGGGRSRSCTLRRRRGSPRPGDIEGPPQPLRATRAISSSAASGPR